ncbi:marine proteobacterial sortase target protein [Brucella pseudogrignonensis]|uniref:marine proteobacterial sortase target protein n=1 Tax=Brucella pseudogrignonensis TaxID=419475 RepID=UPI000CFA8537|nr:marine proteobacterial sortase target protein [Brucella pseudogrignonensis]MQP41452.1 marine proteobacterial sortase target protein [Ochrobactrum sp. MYb237]PQZ40015.1 marine proteobacterial sortase target protein [Brucella pseudogrignonensis]PRA39827.1 marine proteobacterial sortase target protein [Brucella pseudogrignonensis]PRA66260.1 marine proteobacterial sortase target protein [Brucella pseudogrignonensis]
MSPAIRHSHRSGRAISLSQFCKLIWFVNMLILPILAVVLSLLNVASARAETPAYLTPNAVQSGSLLLQGSKEGQYVEAPRISTDYNIDVSGPTARARLSQIFENPTNGWVEGLYVFPLPEDSAVYSLKMIVGDRVIVADIKEKQAAREIYEKAKSEGKKAALIEQQRPNIFTNAVANLGPHEKVVIQIEYQQAVRLSDNRFSLRLPLVVAPRYNPENSDPIEQSADLSGGWGQPKTRPAPGPDNSAIETPLIMPGEERINPVTITVDLKPGFPATDIKSLYHPVRIDRQNEQTAKIVLDGKATADRDFVLEWQAAQTDMPNVGLFRERVGNEDYVLAYVTPPLAKTNAAQSREIVFVIDNSGSMGGTSMTQAKASLDYGLSHLNPGDRFNVIRFDDTLTKFFEDSVDATQQNINDARQYVASLEAVGGTEMLPALHAALDDSHQKDGLRQIVFLTDGEISNEQQMFDVIASRRDRSRLFMVGIGSAPNTYLMSKASELGRGTFTHIGSSEELEQRMRELFDKLQNPAVTDLKVNFSQEGANLTPGILPDIYHGEPLVIAARTKNATGTITVQGTVGSRPWTITMSLDAASPAEGISKIWARRKIDDAEVDMKLGKISVLAADTRILNLALEHHLVTRLTSLVAVDQTPARPENTPLTRADIPLELPAGWDFETLFGIRAERSVLDHADAGQDQIKVRTQERVNMPSVPAPATPLPQTATPATLNMLQGLGVLFIGFLIFWFSRRRGNA